MHASNSPIHEANDARAQFRNGQKHFGRLTRRTGHGEWGGFVVDISIRNGTTSPQFYIVDEFFHGGGWPTSRWTNDRAGTTD